MRLEGGCRCGRVRYLVDGVSDLTSVCHCRMCQRASGGPFMVFVRFGNADVTWSTPPDVFRSSSVAERGFRQACGTPLSYREVGSAHVSLTLHSLDDPEVMPAPDVSFVTERKAAWLSGIDALPTDPWDPTTRPDFINHQK